MPGTKKFTTRPETPRPYDPERLSPDELAWHYCGPTALDGILSKHELWASSVAFMNDTTEAFRGSDALRERFEEVKATLPAPVAAMVERSLFDRDREPSAVYGYDKFLLSASWDGDNLSTWRAYGSTDISYAVGIDPEQFLAPIGRKEKRDPHPGPEYEANRFVNGDDGQQIEVAGWDRGFFSDPRWFKAVYEEARQEEIAASALEHLQELAGKVREPSEGQWGEIQHQISKAFLGVALDERRDLAIYQIKHPGFVDEREARLVLAAYPAWRFVNFRTSKLGFVPYVRLTSYDKRGILGHHPKKSRPLPIKKICIGPTRYPDVAQAGLEGLLARNGYHDVEVIHSAIPFRPV